MDDSLRRRLDAVIALLGIIAVVAVTALLLSFGRTAIAPAFVIAFTGVLVGIFAAEELY
ncbi:hypothetical protein PM076_09960 [Halorubrum ezzemoulense]|uniref:Uncharacterized protein n=1 Tax=Halorubrum ezzemoulense TaxID=337243 RepID=A0ABT4Z0H3_HALEZ|nr:hypothetical protein [Halorubrum ezzemoulense]MDB2243795.1 hypothetical protein [Halorubrum ezzemoulense]MDB2251861.1 hypothetical protein [Halorubrum ezzemoulense]MDB2277531.1 hypothetical protein [Halorubrum ezzemoulense]MDB2284241.1 hypothetical protein [Halorubrum ezzemoulense]MDB2289158.1 hypothetical protein [Halorubrum ezzemoulense]